MEGSDEHAPQSIASSSPGDRKLAVDVPHIDACWERWPKFKKNAVQSVTFPTIVQQDRGCEPNRDLWRNCCFAKISPPSTFLPLFLLGEGSNYHLSHSSPCFSWSAGEGRIHPRSTLPNILRRTPEATTAIFESIKGEVILYNDTIGGSDKAFYSSRPGCQQSGVRLIYFFLH